MKIGLLGGSFNPAHRGHRRISRFAAAALGLDEVWWLVSPGNPLKRRARDMAPLATRLRSARAMARRLPIRATAIEAKLGTRYTVDTVRALIRRHPRDRFVWLMGGDIVGEMHRWRDWRGLAALVRLAVVTRPGHPGLAARAPAAAWLRRFRRQATRARHWPDWSLPVVVALSLPPDSTAATAIRRARPDWAARFGDKAVYDPVALTHIGLATEKGLATAHD